MSIDVTPDLPRHGDDVAALDISHRELLDLSARFSRLFLKWLDACPEGGFTYPRLRVLEALHCQGPAKMKSLADALGLSARNMTAVADSLESEGLLRRVAHPTDRRATLLGADRRWPRRGRQVTGTAARRDQPPVRRAAAGNSNQPSWHSGDLGCRDGVGLQPPGRVLSVVPTALAAVRRSVLDLSVLNDGQTSADALQTTAALAKRADELGYTRFWVAEHHNMPSVACTSPAVLIAHLAALTSNIRVGSGGVMLPNHAPLVVAEQFAMLEGLHPGRIDVGIGRAPGTDQRTAAVLRRSYRPADRRRLPSRLPRPDGFARRSAHRRRGCGTTSGQHPRRRLFPQVFLLGSSGYSAQLAGHLGLPFAFAHHFDTGGTMQATELYRHTFQPSAVLDEPYMIVTANVLAADSKEDADWHSAPGRLTALGRRTGRFIRLPSPQDAAVHPDLEQANSLPSSRIVGEISTVVMRARRARRSHRRQRADGHVGCVRPVGAPAQHRAARRALDRPGTRPRALTRTAMLGAADAERSPALYGLGGDAVLSGPVARGEVGQVWRLTTSRRRVGGQGAVRATVGG